MKKRVSAGVGLAVTVIFLWLAARNVDFSQLGAILASARWRWLLVTVIICLLDLVIRAVRWRLLLSGAVKGPFFLMFRLQAIGLAVNNVLFARLGELARAVLGARELGAPLPAVLASIAVERALDVAALLTLFVAASAGVPELVDAPVRRGALLLLAGAVGALLFLVLAEKSLDEGGLLEVRLRPWPKVHHFVEQLALGAAVLKRPAAALPIVALSLALWLIDAGAYWASARALGLGSLMDYKRAILVLSWAGAGAAVPAAPGAIGTFEAMVKAILMKLGAGANDAFAYALFTHMVNYILVTVIGLVFLSRIGLSLGKLQSSLEEKT